MRGLLVAALGLLVLGGCGGNNPDQSGRRNDRIQALENTLANGAAPGENVAATVVGFSDQQRNVVLIRALLDAGVRCDGVSKSERMPDEQGMPTWRATCRDGTQHLVSISPTGTAHVLTRRDVR